jgi:hypothetical protein
MLARIVFTPADHTLARWSTQVASLSTGKAHAAFARAVNHTTDKVKTEVVRTLVKQTSAPRFLVVSQLRVFRASTKMGNALEARIDGTGSELSLRYFGARQFGKGTRARVWGKSRMFPGAFMGPKPGAVASKLRGHVFHRTGDARLPIEMMFGPSIPKEMVKDETEAVFQNRVGVWLPARVDHELRRLLK